MKTRSFGNTGIQVTPVGLGTWAIGVSNFTPAQMQEFSKFAPLHSLQPPL